MAYDIRQALLDASSQLGVSPLDLATAVSYETAGTFDPLKKGPTTQWGQHQGLIQWGKPQAQKYLGGDFSLPSQSKGMVGYLKDTGVKPGMGLLDIYSAINAGGVGRYGASDANNGGAPGNVRDKVENQMAGHRKNAMGLLGADFAQMPDGPKGHESYPPPGLGGSPAGLAPATNAPGGILSGLGIPQGAADEIAATLSAPDERQQSPLQNLFAALAKTPNADAPRLGQMGDARQSGDALLKALNARTISDLLLQKRMQG